MKALLKFITVFFSFRYPYGRKMRALNLCFLNKKRLIIAGAPRSGTTILTALLGAHPSIQIINHETYIFARGDKRKSKTFSKYRDLLSIFFDIIKEPIKSDAVYWVEKSPSNIKKIGNTLKKFPNMKFIIIERDGRDVVTSKIRGEYFVPVNRWVEDIQLGRQWYDDKRFFFLNYDNLVEKPEKELKKIFEFMELPIIENLSSDFTSKTTLKSHLAWDHTVKPIFKREIPKWKNKEHEHRISEFQRHNEAQKLIKEYFIAKPGTILNNN